MGRILGIDLGTTNTCAAVLDGTETTVIRMADGRGTMPSVVAFRSGREPLVGTAARRQAVTNARGTIHSIKRFLGRPRKSAEVEAAQRLVSYALTEGKDGLVRVEVDGVEHRPEDISALVLKKVKELAEEQLGEAIREAVIAVPAYFTDPQRQATREAGRLVGLDVKRLINEPTAAAVAYGLGASVREKIVAVFDLGGGTFDISLLRIVKGTTRVLATAGDSALGGDNFDERLVSRWVEEIQAATDARVLDDPVVRQRLREAAEATKVGLSAQESMPVSLPFLLETKQGPFHFAREVTRAELEGLTQDLLSRLRGPCETCLLDAKIKIQEIDEVLLVGGMTQTPAVCSWVEGYFGRPPSRVLNPAEVVAKGAAIQGGVLSGDVAGLRLVDVTPHTLGIRVKGGKVSPLIARNTSVPCEHTKSFVTTEDEQAVVVIDVVQGEDPRSDGCTALGRFELDIPRRRRGSVAVSVTFAINSDGMVVVTARETQTSRSATVRLAVGPGGERQPSEADHG
jgi:molecular chaperone DnaK